MSRHVSSRSLVASTAFLLAIALGGCSVGPFLQTAVTNTGPVIHATSQELKILRSYTYCASNSCSGATMQNYGLLGGLRIDNGALVTDENSCTTQNSTCTETLCQCRTGKGNTAGSRAFDLVAPLAPLRRASGVWDINTDEHAFGDFGSQLKVRSVAVTSADGSVSVLVSSQGNPFLRTGGKTFAINIGSEALVGIIKVKGVNVLITEAGIFNLSGASQNPAPLEAWASLAELPAGLPTIGRGKKILIGGTRLVVFDGGAASGVGSGAGPARLTVYDLASTTPIVSLDLPAAYPAARSDAAVFSGATTPAGTFLYLTVPTRMPPGSWSPTPTPAALYAYEVVGSTITPVAEGVTIDDGLVSAATAIEVGGEPGLLAFSYVPGAIEGGYEAVTTSHPHIWLISDLRKRLVRDAYDGPTPINAVMTNISGEQTRAVSIVRGAEAYVYLVTYVRSGSTDAKLWGWHLTANPTAPSLSSSPSSNPSSAPTTMFYDPETGHEMAGPLAWASPGKPGTLGRFVASWKTVTCTAADATTCEVDDPSIVLTTPPIAINVIDGPGADLRLTARGAWAPIQVLLPGETTPIATLQTDGSSATQDINLGTTIEGSGTAYTSIRLRIALDHAKGPVAMELAGLRSLNGGSLLPLMGLDATQMSYAAPTVSIPAQGTPRPCRDTKGVDRAYFLPDGSGTCTDSPGVWLTLVGGNLAYIPTWTTATCDCAADPRAACVARDPSSFGDTILRMQVTDRAGPDLRFTVPPAGTVFASRTYTLPGSEAVRTFARSVSATSHGQWVTALVFGEGASPVGILGADAAALNQTVDFGKNNNSTRSAFVLRTTNGGVACDGLILRTPVIATAADAPPLTNAVCSDGIRTSPEVCDPGSALARPPVPADLGGVTCRSLGFVNGPAGQPPRCSSNCRGFTTATCTGQFRPPVGIPTPPTTSPSSMPQGPGCGNGKRDVGEVCDGADTGGLMCSGFGFSGGALGCLANCTGLDTSGCVGSLTDPLPADVACTPGDPTCHADALDAPSRPPQQVSSDLGARAIATWLIGISGVLAVLFVVYGGFQYITAGADEERIRRARRTIRNALIGVVVVFFSYAIVLGILHALS